MEPKKVDEVLKNECWVNSMNEELKQFDRNQVWTLVEKPNNFSVMKMKWVFRNKKVENGKVVRTKARLVA